jgi:hypothetical protein
LSDAIDFLPGVTLKPKMIETKFDFVLNNHQDEKRIFAFFRWRAEPNVVPSLRSAIANNREPAQVCVEIDRTFEVTAIDRDMGPAWHVERPHLAGGTPASCRRVASILARA